MTVAAGVTAIRAEAARVGRPLEELDLSVLVGHGGFETARMERRVRELHELGFQRIIFVLDPAAPHTQWPVLNQFAGLVKRFQASTPPSSTR